MLSFTKLETGSYNVTLERKIIGTIDPVKVNHEIIGYQYTPKGKPRGSAWSGSIFDTYGQCRQSVIGD